MNTEADTCHSKCAGLQLGKTGCGSGKIIKLLSLGQEFHQDFLTSKSLISESLST